MSDVRDNDPEQATTVRLDASYRLDPRGLSSDEQSFARLLGFGEDGQPPAPTVVPDAPKPLPARTRAESAAAVPDPASEVAAERATEAGSDAPLLAVQSVESDRPVESAEASVPIEREAGAEAGIQAEVARRDWEEIHPRAASLGRQSTLLARADRIVRLEPGERMAAADPSSASAGGLEAGDTQAAVAATEALWRGRLAASESRIAALESARREHERALAARDEELASRAATALAPPPRATADAPQPELAKRLESVMNELQQVEQERDRLGDELAIAHAARLEATARAERLESALRAAAGPNGPIPEGDRDLRAEVIGLRRRLEESGSENRRLRESLDATATELAIARVHRDDREHELEQVRELIESLDRDRAERIARTDELLAKQRELLALMARVQAENVELRSTQAALEETLEARDLEISAREEHLQVTRRGLATRDGQLLDAEERLEQARHRYELLETELARARLAQAELETQLARREARVATLSLKLQRVEEAIGARGTRPETSSVEGSPEDACEKPTDPSTEAATGESNEREGTDDEDRTSATRPEAALERPATTASTEPIPAAWRDAQIRLHCGEQAGATVAALFARRLLEARPSHGEALRVLSLAGDRLDAEVALHAALEAAGGPPVTIEVLEISEERAALRRACIEAAGRSDSILVLRCDASEAEPVQALLFDTALFGRAQVQGSIAGLANRLAAGGVVLFCDRLAGGPVALSEETRAKLAELWQVLPESWTGRPELAVAPEPGDDGGAPAAGNGALDALLNRFAPRLRVGFGHVADLFVGPARVQALMQDPAAAESLLVSIDAIDESRSIHESLTARHGLAVLVARDASAASDPVPCEAHGLPWP